MEKRGSHDARPAAGRRHCLPLHIAIAAMACGSNSSVQGVADLRVTPLPLTPQDILNDIEKIWMVCAQRRLRTFISETQQQQKFRAPRTGREGGRVCGGLGPGTQQQEQAQEGVDEGVRGGCNRHPKVTVTASVGSLTALQLHLAQPCASSERSHLQFTQVKVAFFQAR